MTFNISVLLRESAAEHPDRPCVILGDRAWIYAEVDAAADLVAANLSGLGLAPGTSVAVQLRTSRSSCSPTSASSVPASSWSPSTPC